MTIIFCAMMGVMNIYPIQGFFKRDAKILPQTRRDFIENKLNELKQKLNVKRQIEVFESEHTIAAAWGNEICSVKLGIAIHPKKYSSSETDKDLEFALAHEISHIKHNDTLRKSAFSGLIIFISEIALSILFSSSLILSMGCLVALSVTINLIALAAIFKFVQWAEKAADLSAASVCSTEATQAFIRECERIRTCHINYRNGPGVGLIENLWNKLTITPNGDLRIDVSHPPFETRIKYLQEFVERRASLRETVPLAG